MDFSVLSTMSDESPRRITSSSPPASSFVYPVRSLLSAIEPAALPKSTSTVSSFFCLGDSELHHFRSAPDTNSHAPENSQILTTGLAEANDKLKEECDFTCANQSLESGELLGTTQSRQKTSCMSHVSSSSSLPLASSHIQPQSHYRSPNPAGSSQHGEINISGRMSSSQKNRHFSGEEENQNFFRTSSSVPVELASSCLVSGSENQTETGGCHATPLPLFISPDSAVRGISLLPSVDLSALSVSSTDNLSPLESSQSLVTTAKDMDCVAIVSDNIPNSKVDSVQDLPYNLSQYGLVHLPPPPSSAGIDYGGSGTSILSRQPSASRSDHTHKHEFLSSGRFHLTSDTESSGYHSAPLDLLPSTITKEVPSSAPRSISPMEGPLPASETKLLEIRRMQSGVLSVGDESSETGTTSESTADAESMWKGGSENEEHVAFRFQYAQDDNGNHVIVGREGKLQRCEDEVRD